MIEARGTLAALTKFLYEFYRSDQLQQITKLQLTAKPGARELQIHLQCRGADPARRHAQRQPARRQIGPAQAGQRRRIRKEHRRPRPVQAIHATASAAADRPHAPRPPAPKFDEASQAYVTGILGPPVNLQAWITVRTTGEVLRVHTGDDVKVGEFKGKVESISPLMIVIKTEDDKQLRVKLGSSLREEEKEKAEGDEAAKPAEKEEDT